MSLRLGPERSGWCCSKHSEPAFSLGSLSQKVPSLLSRSERYWRDMDRWLVGLVLAISVCVVDGCGTTGTNTTSARSACSLLSPAQLTQALGEHAAKVGPTAPLPGKQNQSICEWQGAAAASAPIGSFPTPLFLAVYWGPSAVAAFKLAHSGGIPPVPMNPPPGFTTTALTYASVTVDGKPAYWATQNLAPGGGPREILDATKDGDVLVLGANALSQAQLERILGQVLQKI